MHKTNESIIIIQAEAISPIQTNVVFWSHDRGTAKLRFKLMKDRLPQSLPEGTVVPIRLLFKSSTAEGGYGKHDYLATIEDRVSGIVSIVLEDNILGYQGKVEGSIYIDFPNDQSLDTAGRFSFNIKRSPIDDSTPELEDYYFNGFSQTIDKIEKMIADAKTEIDEKVAASSTEIDGKLKDTNDKITKANQDVATINSNIDKANVRIDQTNQQIGDLGKLKKMYANSIDFGDYDYSGNPNLMPYITDPWTGSLLANGTTTQENRTLKHTKTRFTDDGDVLSLGFGIPRTAEAKNSYLINGLTPSTKYSITVKINVGEDWTGGTETIGIRLRYLNSSGGTEIPVTAMLSTGLERNKFHTLTATGTTKADLAGMSNCYIQVFSTKAEFLGTVVVDYDIKLEKGDPSPYQPNLLDAPYYLSKIPLGKNIADKTVAFPIKSSEYKIYDGINAETYRVGQKYTVILKGTKPSTQTFNVFMNRGTIGVGSMVPVEGKANVWQKTFTVSQANIDAGATNILTVYQVPNTTLGECNIEWIKIEKGDTATPNISIFKYFGEGLKDSDNPTDYSWDITKEYAEKTMKDAVNVHDPQEVEGLKNFVDGLQISGKDVATIADLNKTAITTINNKDGEIADFNLNGAIFGFGSEIKTTGTNAAFTRNADKKLVCQIAGTYIFNGQLSVQVRTTIDAWHYVDMRVNEETVGSPWARGVQSFKNRWNFSGMLQVTLKVGDVIDFVSSSSETGATTGQFISCPLAVFQRIGD